jgi:selenium-binding protein 1
MNLKQTYAHKSSVAMLAILAWLGICSTSYAEEREHSSEDTLLIWGGDKAHKAADFLAVIDFDRDSPRYGKVLRTIPLPATLPTTAKDGSTGATGNEPHHVGVSADGKTLVLGGLLSFLRGQDQIFFYDITEPREPKFIGANNPGYNPQTGAVAASIADEAKPLSSGGFLVTFMGGTNGGQPGRVVEYDKDHNYVNAWPKNLPPSDFNPHGITIDEPHNLFLTSDFICPLHTLTGLGFTAAADFRGSVRVWDLEKRKIVKTIPVGSPKIPAGTINIELIPNDPKLRAFVSGSNDGKLYIVDPKEGTAKVAYDFAADPAFKVANAPVWPHLFRINRAGTRLYITLNYTALAGKVVDLDISNPQHPFVRSVIDLGINSGPHYIALSKDERRLIVSDYFLNEDLAPPGVVQVEGDLKVHVIDVSDDWLRFDRRFDLDFSRDISTGPAQPHGLVLAGTAHHEAFREDHDGDDR